MEHQAHWPASASPPHQRDPLQRMLVPPPRSEKRAAGGAVRHQGQPRAVAQIPLPRGRAERRGYRPWIEGQRVLGARRRHASVISQQNKEQTRAPVLPTEGAILAHVVQGAVPQLIELIQAIRCKTMYVDGRMSLHDGKDPSDKVDLVKFKPCHQESSEHIRNRGLLRGEVVPELLGEIKVRACMKKCGQNNKPTAGMPHRRHWLSLTGPAPHLRAQ